MLLGFILYQVRRSVRGSRWVGWRTVIILRVVSLFFCCCCFFVVFFISDCKERILLAGLHTDLVRGTKTEKEKEEKGGMRLC